MNELQAKELLRRYRDGICTDVERHIVESWIDAELADGTWNATAEEKKQFALSLKDRIDQERLLDNEVCPKVAKVYLFRPLWSRIAAVAIVLIAFGIGLSYYWSFSTNRQLQDNTVTAEILPAGDKATLTLADGRQISLEEAANGQLADQSGIQISKTSNGELVYAVKEVEALSEIATYNTISTPKGGKYQILLPDGTKVWLNAASSLRFPVHFTDNERTVELRGEGFFEVAKDKNRSFVVRSAGQQVMVLGTQFNVNAYPEENITRTTLLEGVVSVYTDASKNKVVLKPGEQAASNGQGIRVSKVDTYQVMGWKNGDFVFNGEDVHEVMHQLARWYDIDVAYEGNVSDIGFVSTISRSKNLSEVITILQKTEGINFRIEGRRVVVMP